MLKHAPNVMGSAYLIQQALRKAGFAKGVFEVINEISVRIGLPPPGYRYVRVAADILMIAVGTGMVIDAVEDLTR